MVGLKELFQLKEALQNTNPYITEGIFYSKEKDLFICGPLDEEW